MDSIGPVSRKHQDWFDENDKEIQGLLEEKHQKHKAYLRNTSSVSSKTAYSNICKTVQTRLRDMQDSWLRKKADEIQSFADRKDMTKFFDALKTVYGPQSSGTTPLLSADGTSLLTDKEAILKRLAEHFDGVLNRPSSINDEAINRLPQVEWNPLLDELPTVSETVKAIKLLSSGKAPGSDAIPAEIYKAGGPPVAEKLTELFHIMWRKEAIPQEFKDATIIHLFKRKGNPQVCDNHRGISLLSIAGKILARVLLNRLNEHLERSGLLPESQCGFRKNRNNTHDLHSTTASRKMPGTECGPLHDLCRPYQSLWHSQSWGTLENYGKVWLSCQIHSNSVAVPWWYACKGLKWWRVFWSISCDKWS